ncbi:Polygalacturonase [Thalictrum thalictroides]|uniref:Polygalacturonase n=1 Tax=Thalictrum thalictroides TaxID=46969 RepID=A0A7J6X8E1_THATH|nr:Polygalacturonase [Thalictrum thalictroides]
MVAFMWTIISFLLICLTIETTYCSRFAPAPSPNPESVSTAGAPGSHSETHHPSRAAPASAPAHDPTSEASAPSAAIPESMRRIFDVTQYGAVSDGQSDSQLAFLSAWNDVCDWDGEPTLLIPKGTFFVSPITFQGPCYNNYPLKIEIAGTLKAPSDVHEFEEPSWIVIKKLNNFIFTGNFTGILDGQGEESWARPPCRGKKRCKEYPHSIRFRKVSNATISNISLLNSKCFHISFLDSSNVLMSGINITAPGNSRNTDGIHLSRSSDIKITSSRIGVGDDCVSIGAGNTNIAIFSVYCGPGHGISVGSLGKYDNEKDVAGISVKNCTINSTTNGLRIKTWPGPQAIKVNNISFEDIKMINVSNPIIIDQKYCPGHSCDSDISSVELNNIRFFNIKGTSHTSSAVNIFCSPKVPCKNLHLRDINLTYANGSTFAESTCFNTLGANFEMENPIPCVNSDQSYLAPWNMENNLH